MTSARRTVLVTGGSAITGQTLMVDGGYAP